MCGAGSAGAGVIVTIRDAIMARCAAIVCVPVELNLLSRHGVSKEEASEYFNIVDADGLISKARLVKERIFNWTYQEEPW